MLPHDPTVSRSPHKHRATAERSLEMRDSSSTVRATLLCRRVLVSLQYQPAVVAVCRTATVRRRRWRALRLRSAVSAMRRSGPPRRVRSGASASCCPVVDTSRHSRHSFTVSNTGIYTKPPPHFRDVTKPMRDAQRQFEESRREAAAACSRGAARGHRFVAGLLRLGRETAHDIALGYTVDAADFGCGLDDHEARLGRGKLRCPSR